MLLGDLLFLAALIFSTVAIWVEGVYWGWWECPDAWLDLGIRRENASIGGALRLIAIGGALFAGSIACFVAQFRQ